MSAEHHALLRSAFDAYLARLDEGNLDPRSTLLPYDFLLIERSRLSMCAGEMIRDELRELTNRLNQWQLALLRWHAWNVVIAQYEQAQAWDLRREFLEPLVHWCLMQPSAIRDTLTFVTTNAVHQVRLAQGGGYVDRMTGDPQRPGDKPLHLTRRKKEARLEGMLEPWPRRIEFMRLLRQLDGESYRQATHDYRNRSSHAIGPRIALGITQAVTRSVVQATTLVQQPDNTFRDEPVPGALTVSYAVGGTLPLDPEAARQANLAEFAIARSCYGSFHDDLYEAVAALPRQ